jgi:hypothetical protein
MIDRPPDESADQNVKIQQTPLRHWTKAAEMTNETSHFDGVSDSTDHAFLVFSVALGSTRYLSSETIRTHS